MSRSLRAALYARVSTDEQGPEVQFADLRRMAELRGWLVVDEYVDHGVSGAKAGRPALERLQSAAAMLEKGHGLKTTAKALGVARSTLRKRLVEAGEWPRLRGVSKGR